MALAIAPSRHWLGNDGPWSTFDFRIGNDSQLVQVLPATSGQGIVVVLPGGCPASLASCESLRGGTWRPDEDIMHDSPNQSNIFDVQFPSMISLPETLFTEQHLERVELVYYLYENSLVDTGRNESIEAVDQLIGGYVPFIGLMGLSSQPVAFANGTGSFDGLLKTLLRRVNGTSASWAYTAGAKYKIPESFGSLTLGGYDASLCEMDSAMSVPLTSDPTRDLVVTVSNIEVHWNSTTRVYPLLRSPVSAFLNSAESDIWLPESDCLIIEEELGLSWNSTFEMYLLNATLAEYLISSIYSIDISLAGGTGITSSTIIRLPLYAFLREVKWPLAGINDTDTTLRRFALRRAPTPGSATLGRTFFQEA